MHYALLWLEFLKSWPKKPLSCVQVSYFYICFHFTYQLFVYNFLFFSHSCSHRHRFRIFGRNIHRLHRRSQNLFGSSRSWTIQHRKVQFRIQIRNMKMDFNIYGTWHRVTFEKLMMKIYDFLFG